MMSAFACALLQHQADCAPAALLALILLCSSILQGTSGDDQHTLNDSTCGQRDSSSSGSTGGGSKGHDTLFFAGSLYHTYNGELINLTSRPGTASGSPGRYNPLVRGTLRDGHGAWQAHPRSALMP